MWFNLLPASARLLLRVVCTLNKLQKISSPRTCSLGDASRHLTRGAGNPTCSLRSHQLSPRQFSTPGSIPGNEGRRQTIKQGDIRPGE